MSKRISYAQNFEDVILWRALSHVPRGRYVDIGAQSPDTDSVSRMFYENGWRGVHVEPALQYANLLRERRPDEIVLQMAVSDRPGILQFFEITDSGLSTTDPEIAARHGSQGFKVQDIRVPSVTLDAVLEQVGDGPVHWLKIDVEGAEAAVIRGWNATSVRPWVIVVESTRPLSPEQTHAQWEPMLVGHGYEFVYFDGLNRFYVSAEHPELKAAFGAGPNVFDDFWLSPHSQFCGLVNTSYAALQAEVDVQRARLHEAENRHAELNAHLEAELNARDAELERQRKEHAKAAATLEAYLDAAKHEAHRWWLAHEQLLAELEAMRRSRSWQLTRPLRAIRRRLPVGVHGRTKRVLRATVVRMLEVAVMFPRLRGVAKPMVARMPFLYGRLRALAVHEHLIEGNGPQHGLFVGRERDHEAVYLDKRASRVLADLKRSRNRMSPK